VANLHT